MPWVHPFLFVELPAPHPTQKSGIETYGGNYQVSFAGGVRPPPHRSAVSNTHQSIAVCCHAISVIPECMPPVIR